MKETLEMKKERLNKYDKMLELMCKCSLIVQRGSESWKKWHELSLKRDRLAYKIQRMSEVR